MRAVAAFDQHRRALVDASSPFLNVLTKASSCFSNSRKTSQRPQRAVLAGILAGWNTDRLVLTRHFIPLRTLVLARGRRQVPPRCSRAMSFLNDSALQFARPSDRPLVSRSSIAIDRFACWIAILVLEDEFLIAMDVEQLCRDHGAARCRHRAQTSRSWSRTARSTASTRRSST